MRWTMGLARRRTYPLALLLAFLTLGVAPASAQSRTAAATTGARIGTSSGSHSFLSRLEAEVLAEMNFARTRPREYAAVLERMLPHFDGRVLRLPGETAVETSEGARAVREAIRALRRAEPVPPFSVSRGMSRAAEDHVRDQSRSGSTGHAGRDGSRVDARVNRYGRWGVMLSENIAYGPPTARGIVAGLLIDDGVPDRGHRANMLDPSARVVGVACGSHPRYRRMCVIVHAGAYEER